MNSLRSQAKRILSHHCKIVYKLTGVYNKSKAKKICLNEMNQFFNDTEKLDLTNKNVFMNYNSFVELKKQIEKL